MTTAMRYVVLLLVGLAGSVGAEMATRRWGTPPQGAPRKAGKAPPPAPPAGYVAPTSRAPKIDGELSDEVWDAAPALRLERTLNGSARAPQPTEVRLLCVPPALYLGFRCTEPSVGKLRASQRGHDADVWLDDSVEVFLGSGDAYYHFGIAAGGGTYDARGKDRAWDCGFRAAVGRGKGEWTAEAEIPLAKLAGGARLPEAWIANFNRNRYTAGTWEEMAWSPTLSGDSHVPARFGKLLLKEPPPDAKPPVAPPGARRAGAATVLPCEGGEGVVVFDLSDLPPKATIYRADLFIFRTAAVTGAHPESLVEIAIHPLFEKLADGKPRELGKPLALREPALDRFDATDPVRQWASGKPNGGFFVKTCPLWNAEATCLEVAYEDTPADVPPRVPRVEAFHRAGQTFITWGEADPLIASEETTWGEIKAKLAGARDTCHYRIYSSAKPISARTLPDATLIAEVGPLSAYNVNARNKEYLVGQAMAQPDEMGELARDYNGYMHTWTMDSPRMDRYPVKRFVVDEKAGPLPVGTGLYVHHPASPGQRHYAVVTVRGGVENTREIACAGPLEETVGLGEPVRQGQGLWGPFFDYPGTRWVYVQWCAPPLSPRPNMAFSWSVLAPPDVEGKVPAELYFHPEGYSYAQPGQKMLVGSIQLAPHDHPPSGWYGFNDAYGTLKSFKAGVVRNHTQQRIIAFLEWAKRALPIDPARILAVGADGAAALALSYPDQFAYVLVTGFDRQGMLEPKAVGKFAAAWGPKSPDIKDREGRSEWRWACLDELVAASPGRDLPLFVCRGASWGAEKGWGKGRGRFYRAMHAAGQPLVAHWAWGGQLQKPDRLTGLWRGLDIRSDAFIPAFANCSLDQEGEGSGNTNMSFTWKDVADTPGGLAITVLGTACTFDLTPRRLQGFKIKPGENLSWEAAPLPGRSREEPKPQGGEVAADAHGVATIKGLAIPGDCPGITVRITRREAQP